MFAFWKHRNFRNEDARLYDLNAIKTIESYALNATQFNKTMSLFSSFMTMAKDLNPSHYKDEKLQDSIDSILDFMSVKLNSTLYGYKNANNAVKQAVKNLILTNHYEKPFHPEIGSNLRGMLFENITPQRSH